MCGFIIAGQTRRGVAPLYAVHHHDIRGYNVRDSEVLEKNRGVTCKRRKVRSFRNSLP